MWTSPAPPDVNPGSTRLLQEDEGALRVAAGAGRPPPPPSRACPGLRHKGGAEAPGAPRFAAPAAPTCPGGMSGERREGEEGGGGIANGLLFALVLLGDLVQVPPHRADGLARKYQGVMDAMADELCASKVFPFVQNLLHLISCMMNGLMKGGAHTHIYFTCLAAQ